MAGGMVRGANSEIPDLDNGLWERVRDAVAAESGSAVSLWNGQLNYTDNPEYRGAAYSDGKIELNRTLVVEQLQEMYATRGQPATAEQWSIRRNALKTVAHEFDHLAGPEGFTHDRWLNDLQPLEYRPLEEGVTEAWSQAKLDAIADRALPPDLAAQVKAVRAPHSYPGYEPAARAFADQVGAEANLSGNEVLRRMASQPPMSKARAAADVLFDSSDLPNLVPAAEQEAVRERLATQINQDFGKLQSLNESTAPNLRAISHARGMEISDAATATIRATETQYRDQLARQQTQQFQQATNREQPTIELPRPEPQQQTSQHQPQPVQPQQQQQPVQPQQQAQPRQPAQGPGQQATRPQPQFPRLQPIPPRPQQQPQSQQQQAQTYPPTAGPPQQQPQYTQPQAAAYPQPPQPPSQQQAQGQWWPQPQPQSPQQQPAYPQQQPQPAYPQPQPQPQQQQPVYPQQTPGQQQAQGQWWPQPQPAYPPQQPQQPQPAYPQQQPVYPQQAPGQQQAQGQWWPQPQPQSPQQQSAHPQQQQPQQQQYQQPSRQQSPQQQAYPQQSQQAPGQQQVPGQAQPQYPQPWYAQPTRYQQPGQVNQQPQAQYQQPPQPQPQSPQQQPVYPQQHQQRTQYQQPQAQYQQPPQQQAQYQQPGQVHQQPQQAPGQRQVPGQAQYPQPWYAPPQQQASGYPQQQQASAYPQQQQASGYPQQQQSPQQHAPGQWQQPQQGQGGSASGQDVAALRSVLDHQAPAAGATRVPRGQAASGRRGGAHTTEQSAGRTNDSPSR